MVPQVGEEYSIPAVDILTRQEWQVRETWFSGSAEILIGDARFLYKNTPLLDLALGLRFTVGLLAADGMATMDVPGGPGIRLAVTGNKVITQSGEEDEGVCEFIDLAHASSVFIRALTDQIVQYRPEFLFADLIERTYRESGVREMSRDRFLVHTQMMRSRSALIQGGRF
ncbi:hypothetical protein [Streptomyces sp. NPDC058671]|uniref:hypothetical protein n=1 Tax=unclassified Streptomyces TaxID=2593676 RepID=UPI0036670190